MGFDLKKLGDDASDFVDLMTDGVNLIAQITDAPAVDKAADVLTVVKVVIDALTKAYDGKISTETVRKDWRKLQLSIATNDAKADAALDDKFKTDKTEG